MATIEIEIPYKGTGGIIHQEPVSFEVFQLDGYYQLKPCLSTDERRVANLPESLDFKMQEGKPVSLRGKMDGNFHVIQDVVAQLQKKQPLL